MGGGPQFPNNEVRDELERRISQLGVQVHDEDTATLPDLVRTIVAELTPNDDEDISERVEEQNLSTSYPESRSEDSHLLSIARPSVWVRKAEYGGLSPLVNDQELYCSYDLGTPKATLGQQMYGDPYPGRFGKRVELHRHLLSRWGPPKQQHPFNKHYTPHVSSAQTGHTSRPTQDGPHPLSQQSAPRTSLQHEPLSSAHLGSPEIDQGLPLHQYCDLLYRQPDVPQAIQPNNLPQCPHQPLPLHPALASTAIRAVRPSSPWASVLSEYPPPLGGSPSPTYPVQAEVMDGYDAQALRHQLLPRTTAGNGAVTGGEVEAMDPRILATCLSCGPLEKVASDDHAAAVPGFSETEAAPMEPEQSSGAEMPDTVGSALLQIEKLGDPEKLTSSTEEEAAKSGYRTFEI